MLCSIRLASSKELSYIICCRLADSVTFIYFSCAEWLTSVAIDIGYHYSWFTPLRIYQYPIPEFPNVYSYEQSFAYKGLNSYLFYPPLFLWMYILNLMRESCLYEREIHMHEYSNLPPYTVWAIFNLYTFLLWFFFLKLSLFPIIFDLNYY
jgi:hypothetical protein